MSTGKRWVRMPNSDAAMAILQNTELLQQIKTAAYLYDGQAGALMSLCGGRYTAVVTLYVYIEHSHYISVSDIDYMY